MVATHGSSSGSARGSSSSSSFSESGGGGGGSGGSPSKRGGGGGILAWRAEGERVVRSSLTLFFLYLFGDLDAFYKGTLPLPFTSTTPTTPTTGPATSSSSSSSGEGGWKKGASSPSQEGRNRDVDVAALAAPDAFASSDSRAQYDLAGYLQKKKSAAVGLSRELTLFLTDFMHTQLFEQHCVRGAQRLGGGSGGSGGSGGGSTISTALLSSCGCMGPPGGRAGGG